MYARPERTHLELVLLRGHEQLVRLAIVAESAAEPPAARRCQAHEQQRGEQVHLYIYVWCQPADPLVSAYYFASKAGVRCRKSTGLVTWELLS